MKMEKITKESLDKNDFFVKRYDKTCGAVYIAKYGNGLIKIGSTANPRERYKQLSYSAPEYAGGKIEEFAMTNPLEEYQDLERALHRRFWKWNVRKEIFNVDFQQAVQVVNKEFNKFDYQKDSGFESMAIPAAMKILKSGRLPNDEEQRKLAIMAFEDGMRAYDNKKTTIEASESAGNVPEAPGEGPGHNALNDRCVHGRNGSPESARRVKQNRGKNNG